MTCIKRVSSYDNPSKFRRYNERQKFSSPSSNVMKMLTNNNLSTAIDSKNSESART